MRRTITTLALAALAALAACGTDSSPPGGDDGSGSGSDDPIISQHALTWGPLDVAAATEDTRCVWLRLDNDAEIKVHKLRNTLGASSHHLIVYKDDMDTTEQRTPVACQPFAGALNTSGKVFPMMITQKRDDELVLPPGVAYTLAPHQMIKIEMHYLNASDDKAAATAKVEVFAADPSAIHDEANILFIGTPDIKLPAKARSEVHEFFTPSYANLDLFDAKFFAITGHTHKLGIDVVVNTSDKPAGVMTPVYKPASFQWAEPETATFRPEFKVPEGGGFDFTCSYFNTTDAQVKFGESTEDEMCFFWAYYYPSNGAHVCVHTNQSNLNLNLCCPDAGAAVCDRLFNGAF